MAKKKQNPSVSLPELTARMLGMPLPAGDETALRLKARGIEPTEGAALILAQLDRAKDGCLDAARFIRDSAGQKPADTVKIGNCDGEVIKAVDLSALTDAELRRIAFGEG